MAYRRATPTSACDRVFDACDISTSDIVKIVRVNEIRGEPVVRFFRILPSRATLSKIRYGRRSFFRSAIIYVGIIRNN